MPQKPDKPAPALTTINVDGGMGTWEITYLPDGATSKEQAVKIYAVSSGLLPIVKMFPSTINAIFIGQGICVVDAEGI